ncbi:MAG: YobA family protein [Dethiobacter sp.]|nr:YobA family protein [Dethiobacter sp.]
MRHKIALILAAALLLALITAGCAASSGDPEITGLIVAIEDRRVLVVAGLDEVSTNFEDWEGNRAIYFTVTDKTVIQGSGGKGSFDDLAVGQKVEAWADGAIAESFPEQAAAEKILILK